MDEERECFTKVGGSFGDSIVIWEGVSRTVLELVKLFVSLSTNDGSVDQPLPRSATSLNADTVICGAPIFKGGGGDCGEPPTTKRPSIRGVYQVTCRYHEAFCSSKFLVGKAVKPKSGHPDGHPCFNELCSSPVTLSETNNFYACQLCSRTMHKRCADLVGVVDEPCLSSTQCLLVCSICYENRKLTLAVSWQPTYSQVKYFADNGEEVFSETDSEDDEDHCSWSG